LSKGRKTDSSHCNKRGCGAQHAFSNTPVYTDLARFPLNLPFFSKTSLLTSHVYSIEHLFKRPYAVRDCPEKPLTTLPYKHPQPPVKSVKTRRNPLSDNKLYLQMAGTGYITAEARRSAEIRKDKRQEPIIYKIKKEFIKIVAVPPLRLGGEIILCDGLRNVKDTGKIVIKMRPMIGNIAKLEL
jgi:hypothetical protein